MSARAPFPVQGVEGRLWAPARHGGRHDRRRTHALVLGSALLLLGDTGGSMGTDFGSGTLTFTEVNAATGTFAGTFDFESPAAGVSVTGATFRITGAK